MKNSLHQALSSSDCSLKFWVIGLLLSCALLSACFSQKFLVSENPVCDIYHYFIYTLVIEVWWQLHLALIFLDLTCSPLFHFVKCATRVSSLVYCSWPTLGSSWAAVLEKRSGLSFPADLYLEGTDQHRGWFQSSLLTSITTKGNDHLNVLFIALHGIICSSTLYHYVVSSILNELSVGW